VLCDSCGKNQATVHLTEIVNNKMTEMHLCESCAQDKGTAVKPHFSLADLLAGLTDVGGTFSTDTEKEVTCSVCGLSYRDFKKIGRLGCSECYQAFRDQLAPLLKRIHGASKHVGRAPKGSAKTDQTRNRMYDLQRKLDHAIELEEFETAANLRDQIRKLEKSAKSISEKTKKKKQNRTKQA
jgi:protein arginine kinase activator